MSEKTLLFPYSEGCYGLFKYLERQHYANYDIAAFSGSGYIGKTIEESVNVGKNGRIIQDIFALDWSTYSKIIVLNTTPDKTLIDAIEKTIRRIIKKNNIAQINILNLFLSDDLRDTNTLLSAKKIEDIESYSGYYSNIVFSSGLYETPYQDYNTLNLLEILKKMDLTVCIITSNINLCILKDVFISNLVKNKMSITEETLIQEASLVSELSRKYDFLIIEIPRGIIQINDYIINSLGLYYSFYRIISKPNFQVVDIPWQFSDIETKKAIEKIIYDKYMDNIDVITINNTFLEDLSNFSPGVNDKLLYIQSEVKDSAQILKKCLEEKIRFGTIK